MCTAVSLLSGDFYFGRNLDYEFSYGDEVTVTPRGYTFPMRGHAPLRTRYAIIGMAYVQGDYPLYYDAINEKGLGVAGLNFVGNAVYFPAQAERDNVTQFELIPWLLGQCATLCEARELLGRINLLNEPFSPELPLAQLHWLIADQTGSITVEATADGLHVYDDPVGVLTNNPPFPQQVAALRNYTRLSPSQPPADFGGVPVTLDSRGMGALGLPGDLSSPSRFVRAAFVRTNARSAQTEDASVSQFFHILTSVEQQRGCCELDDGQYEITLYSSCCNADRGIYYYTTYDNRQITGVKLHSADLDSAQLTAYPLVDTQQIRWEN